MKKVIELSCVVIYKSTIFQGIRLFAVIIWQREFIKKKCTYLKVTFGGGFISPEISKRKLYRRSLQFKRNLWSYIESQFNKIESTTEGGNNNNLWLKRYTKSLAEASNALFCQMLARIEPFMELFSSDLHKAIIYQAFHLIQKYESLSMWSSLFNM